MLTGKVFDIKTNKPIWNASIFISDATGKITDAHSGTTSWFDGTYKFEPVSGAEYVTASCVGYKSKTVEIGAWPVIHFNLTEETTELPEVEIISTPVVKKSKILQNAIIGFSVALLAGLVVSKLSNSKNS